MVGVLAIVGAPSAGGDEPEMLTRTGTVVYREPSAPPADALLTVTLEDVSLADAPAVTLGQAQFQLTIRKNMAIHAGQCQACRVGQLAGETELVFEMQQKSRSGHQNSTKA